MKYLNRLVYICLIALCSCGDESEVYSSFKDVPDEVWNWDNPSQFEFTISNNQVTYNQHINLRLTENYPKSNIYVQSQMVTPKGDTLKQLHNFLLFSKEGVSLGNKSGKLLNYSFDIAANKPLEKGTYRVTIIQHTRVFELAGVNAVGFSVSQGDPVF